MTEIIQEKEIVQSEGYVLVVHGFAPELWSGIAFRAERHADSVKRKAIKCPYCGRHLISVDTTTRIEICRFQKAGRQGCHEYKTCRACHEMVGIIFA